MKTIILILATYFTSVHANDLGGSNNGGTPPWTGYVHYQIQTLSVIRTLDTYQQKAVIALIDNKLSEALRLLDLGIQEALKIAPDHQALILGCDLLATLNDPSIPLETISVLRVMTRYYHFLKNEVLMDFLEPSVKNLEAEEAAQNQLFYETKPIRIAHKILQWPISALLRITKQNQINAWNCEEDPRIFFRVTELVVGKAIELMDSLREESFKDHFQFILKDLKNLKQDLEQYNGGQPEAIYSDPQRALQLVAGLLLGLAKDTEKVLNEVIQKPTCKPCQEDSQ